MTRKAPSRGAFDFLRLLQGYDKLPLGCVLKQKKIAGKLGVGLSTLERRVRELKELGAIEVTQRGPTSSAYTFLWSNCRTWERFVELAAKSEGAFEGPSTKPADQALTAKNEGASEGAFEGASGGAPITELLPSGVAELAESGQAPASQLAEVIQHLKRLTDPVRLADRPCDERTLALLAAILGDIKNVERWRQRLSQRLKRDPRVGWGLAVTIAREIKLEIAAPQSAIGSDRDISRPAAPGAGTAPHEPESEAEKVLRWAERHGHPVKNGGDLDRAEIAMRAELSERPPAAPAKMPAARAETGQGDFVSGVPTYSAIRGQITALAAQKGF